MAHSVSPQAEEILDKEYQVLDKGFVRLVDYMGSDDRIVQSARVSYGEGTSSFRKDQGLIDYLLRNEHTSPFEQVVLTFHTKMPIFVARQWVRHRTARLNEISGRYSVMENEFYLPAGDKISLQSEDNKQGRSQNAVEAELQDSILKGLGAQQNDSYKAYEELIEQGLARELARINLPLSLYTQWYWQIDLHNLFHFLRLRLDPHAQYEIRAYAEAMLEIAEKVAPMAVSSFRNHLLGTVRMSSREMEIIRQAMGVSQQKSGDESEQANDGPVQEAISIPNELESLIEQAGLSKRDRERFIIKLTRGRQT